VTKTVAKRQYPFVSESDPPPGTGIASFDDIYDREFSYVWKTLGRLGVAPGDIPDAVHEVFLVLFRRWSEIDPDRPMRPWLFGVARRVAASARRSSRREAPTADLELAGPSDRDQLARRDLLWRALADVDEERRAVLVLHDLEGYTGADIARLLDLPVNTVHSRLRLARGDLLAAVRRLGGAG
jgi:RNA polymerase sigma-70 factor (ECF subfamily)